MSDERKELTLGQEQARILRFMADRPDHVWLEDELLPAVEQFFLGEPDEELRIIINGLCEPGRARIPGASLPVMTVAPVIRTKLDRYVLDVTVDEALAYADELELQVED